MTEQTNRKSINIDALLGKSTETLPQMTTDERRARALNYAQELVDVDTTSAEDAFSAIVREFQNESIDDKQVNRWMEEITTAQFKKFRRDYNKKFGASEAKIDDLRASAVEDAEALVEDREKTSAEDALKALREAAQNDDDSISDNTRAFLQRATERQEKKFGRDWRREQQNPESTSPRVNRFDTMEAKIDALAGLIVSVAQSLNIDIDANALDALVKNSADDDDTDDSTDDDS